MELLFLSTRLRTTAGSLLDFRVPMSSVSPRFMAMAGLSSILELIYEARLYIALIPVIWYLLDSYLSYRKLSHIPGPGLAGWSSLWIVGAIWRKQSHLEFYEVAKKYGECCLAREHQGREHFLPETGSLTMLVQDLSQGSDQICFSPRTLNYCDV